MGLLELPNEILDHIVNYITDSELCNLSSANRELRHRVYTHNDHVWRSRFQKTFDGLSTTDRTFRDEYIGRFTKVYIAHPYESQLVRASGVDPQTLFQVILEADFGSFGKISKNMTYLDEIIDQTDILQHICNPHWLFRCVEFDVIQLLFFHKAANMPQKIRICDFPKAQQVAYGNPATSPLFTRAAIPRVSLQTFLHLATFFIGHLAVFAESEFFSELAGLAPCERPQAWTCSFHNRQTPRLGLNWHGPRTDPPKYSNVRAIRSGQNHQVWVEDKIGPDGFDRLCLSFDEAYTAKQTWPGRLKAILDLVDDDHHLDPGNAFVGNMQTDHDLLIAGFLTPAAVNVLPGWQRIAFIAYSDPEPDTTSNSDLFALTALASKIPMGLDPSEAEKRVEEHRCMTQIPGTGIDELEEMIEANSEARASYREDIEFFLNMPGTQGTVQSRPYRPANLAVDARPDVMTDTLAFEGLVWPGGNVMMGRWWELLSVEAAGAMSSAPGFDPADPPAISWRPVTGAWCYWCIDAGFEWKGPDADK